MKNQKVAIQLIKGLVGQANVLTIPRLFVDFMGSLDGALFLSQCLYWSDRTNNPSGWFYKTYEEWQEEICLSKYEVSKHRKIMEELGFLETVLKKANGAPTVHYRILFDDFLKSFGEFIDNGKLRNLPNQESEENEQSITEITPETTTKNTTNKKDYFSDITSFKPGNEGKAEPRDWEKYFGYRDEFLKTYNELTGEVVTVPAIKEKIALLGAEENARLEIWRKAIEVTITNWSGHSNIPPLTRIIEVYRLGGNYDKWLDRKYGDENRGNGKAAISYK